MISGGDSRERYAGRSPLYRGTKVVLIKCLLMDIASPYSKSKWQLRLVCIEEDISIALPSVEAYPLLLGWGGHRHPVYILSLWGQKEC